MLPIFGDKNRRMLPIFGDKTGHFCQLSVKICDFLVH
jgi:hypothetical protein